MHTEVVATLVDLGGMRVTAVNRSGHELIMDAGRPLGAGSAARPTEALLAALAGCTSMDVVSILRKKRQALVQVLAPPRRSSACSST